MSHIRDQQRFYNLRSGSWLAWANGAAVHYVPSIAIVNLHIHLVMLITVLAKFTSCSKFIGQVSLPCIKQLLTHDLYTYPFRFNKKNFPN